MEPSFAPEADADRLRDHAESPYHQGRLDQPSCAGTERNPCCGDQVHLQLQIDDGRIQQAWFDGRGCAVSQASASMLCEFLEGHTVAAARRLQAQQMLTLLGTPISPARQRCALVALHALKNLLAEEAGE